jgi:hypothetical protein
LKKFTLTDTNTLNSLSLRGVKRRSNPKKDEIATPFGLAMTSKNSKCVCINSKGISVLFLVIAMLLMVTIGYVFSYLIPTKQKSVIFSIYSTQAFFIAQSGVEYAIRYCSDRGWRRASDGTPSRLDLSRLNNAPDNQRNLGNGGFTIYYQNTTGTYSAATDILTSTGQITGSSENRVVRVSNFSSFLRLVFDTGQLAPCWCLGTRRARFYFRNVRGTSITLTGFAASWNSSVIPAPYITRITLDGNTRYNGGGTYYSDPDLSPAQAFSSNETVVSNEQTTVVVYWNVDTSATNIIIKFFDNAGESYTFNLDSAGNGLNATGLCGAGC